MILHQTVQHLDPEDLSWIANEDDMDVEDEPIRVKEVSKRPARPVNADQFDFSVGSRVCPITLTSLTRLLRDLTLSRPLNRPLA